MIRNNYKYNKYKNKYLSLKNHTQKGGDFEHIIIIHPPNIWEKPEIPKDLELIINILKKYGQVHNYFLKFGSLKDKFKLSDIEFDNAANDIYSSYENLDDVIIIALNHASPYGLYYVNKYPKNCKAIICYPFRFYNKVSYERRIWKMKDNKGFDKMVKNKKYNVDDHLINITEERFSKLFDNLEDAEKHIIYLVHDFYMQKHSDLIPTKFKVPTYLYTRLDLDAESVIKYNYKRKEIAEMKQIMNEDDALLNSMIWNFDRVKFDAKLKKENEGNDLLHIKYIISGWEDYKDIIDNIILIKYEDSEKN